MVFIEENLKGLCEKHGLDYADFLDELDVDHAKELSVYDLEAISEEYEVDLQALIFKLTHKTKALKKRLAKIKLLVLDVDGVMTDGGLFFAESGDSYKKFNAKDGMAIARITKNDFNIAIVSSGFAGEAVKRRAEMLGIQHCSVNQESKITRLEAICATLKLDISEVAMIGDDINDLEILQKCGFSACPADAVTRVKDAVDLVLATNGGKGCIREFIDEYLLEERLK